MTNETLFGLKYDKLSLLFSTSLGKLLEFNLAKYIKLLEFKNGTPIDFKE